MEDRDSSIIEDVDLKYVKSDEWEIKFRKNRKKIKLMAFLRGISLVMVSVVAGATGGAYMIQKKFETIYNPVNALYMQNKNEATKVASFSVPNHINMVAENVGPTVVGITNKVDGFLGKPQDASSGSGIIFDQSGYIITNYHVIEGANKISVKLSSGKVFTDKEVKIIGVDARSDLAVIKVSAENLPIARFGDSSKMRVGDIAIAIGNPLGEEFAGSVTSGIISALNRTIDYNGTKYRVMQTDAAINPGNSGGALCNEFGEVIGINSLKMGANYNAEGMGFAISINEAKNIIKALMEFGKVARPKLGVAGGAVSSDNNKIQGFYVTEVEAASGAFEAGVKPTDIILEIDGQTVSQAENILDISDKHKIGDIVKCKIWRNGKTIEVNIKLVEVK